MSQVVSSPARIAVALARTDRGRECTVDELAAIATRIVRVATAARRAASSRKTPARNLNELARLAGPFGVEVLAPFDLDGMCVGLRPLNGHTSGWRNILFVC